MLKEECREAEEESILQKLEYRIREVPESRREDARVLLREERDAIFAVYRDSSTDAGFVGGTAGTYFGIALRLQEAEKRGDTEAVSQLLPLREKAKAELAKIDTAIEKRNERIAEVQRDYAARLQTLIDRNASA